MSAPEPAPARGRLLGRIALGVATLVVVVLALAAWQLGQVTPAPAGRAPSVAYGLPTRLDSPAPGFDLPLLSGHGRLSLAALRGHVVVLNFWASWCTVCRAETPMLVRMWARLHPLGVDFLGVDTLDTSPAAARAFAVAHGERYPSVVDASGALLGPYGLVGLPDTFVISPAGQLRDEVVGAVDPAALTARVLALIHR